MNFWIVSRECAGIAEAGGVKDVTCALSETLSKLKHNVTLFIPLYGCTDLSLIKEFNCAYKNPIFVEVENTSVPVSFAYGKFDDFNVIFVCHQRFYQKKAVYTYTKEEEELDFNHKTGQGHKDVHFLNTLFQKSVAQYFKLCSKEEIPDVIHCQDAPAALLPAFVENFKSTDKAAASFYKNTKMVVTIHNAGPAYHHEFANLGEAAFYTSLPKNMLVEGLNGYRVEPFLIASLYSTITTVSPQYAKEIMSCSTDTDGLAEGFSARNTVIKGITNGFDFDRYDPEDTKKSCLPFAFNPKTLDLNGKYLCREDFLNDYYELNHIYVDGIKQNGFIEAEKDAVYICYHGRVVTQKGIEVMADACKIILNKNLNVRFIFMGQGDPSLEKILIEMAEQNPGKVLYLQGYDKVLSRMVVAVSDFSLHPSHFEPCGLEDFVSQTYGTLPIAHSVGGLMKIQEDKTGFLYSPNTSEKLAEIILSLVEMRKNMGTGYFERRIQYASQYINDVYNWTNVVENEYMKLYKNL